MWHIAPALENTDLAHFQAPLQLYWFHTKVITSLHTENQFRKDYNWKVARECQRLGVFKVFSVAHVCACAACYRTIL